MKAVLRTSCLVYVLVALVVGLGWLLKLPPVVAIWAALTDQSPFSFAYPWMLALLVPLVPLSVASVTRLRRRQVGAMAFTQGDILAQAPKTLKTRLRHAPNVLRVCGIALLVVAVSRPQIAHEERQDVEGIDIYLVLDMSGSMQAIDMSRNEASQLQMRGMSPANRFEIAKTVLQDFVEGRREMPWSDRVGMVIFARYTFLQFPLTIDYSTVLWLLDQLELNDIDAAQTAIGNAIGQAVAGLIDSSGESKIVILITDGDEVGGNISAIAAARVAADQGIQVFPILVGREGRALVPVRRTSGLGVTYAEQEYPVDPELLREVADITGGRFFRAEDREALRETLDAILAEYERTQFEDMIRTERDDIFYPFVWSGFILIGFELLLCYAVLRKFP